MQNLDKKYSGMHSAQSTVKHVVSCPSWGNSTESHVQQSSISESLSLKIGALPQNFQSTKQLSLQFQDQDSSSTQSTGQSYPKVTSVGDSNLYGQSIISTASGYNETHRKLFGGHTKLVSPIGSQDFPHSQADYGQQVAHIPFHYTEPYFGVVAAGYGPQAMVQHPHMMAMVPARVPLPLDITTEHEPIFVNAKQYRAILRRRQYRAKLEAQNRHAKGRKLYLHESRHLHALKRPRGAGGRFLKTKTGEEPKLSSPMSYGPDSSCFIQLHRTGNMSESDVHNNLESHRDAASTTSCSDVTSASNSDDMFHQPDFRFSGYPSHISAIAGKLHHH